LWSSSCNWISWSTLYHRLTVCFEKVTLRQEVQET
jgi:hypothetical protein